MSDIQDNPSLDKLKETHEKLVFIHSVLTQRTQFFLEEMKVADASAQMITDMCNKIYADIEALSPKQESPQEEKQDNE